jgi:hypothetical protein
MELLKHFEEENKKIVVLTLKDDDWDEFVNKLPAEYKRCYISQKELESRIINFASTKEKELSELLPDIGNIKSGDFGEILSFYLFKERHKKQKVDGPKKWRWKQEKNVAAPYTDGILFSIKKIDEPSKDDLLISIESKMKATSNYGYHLLQNAIDGAEKDYVSRIANSLSWLRKKYKDESLKEKAPIPKLKELVEMIERFIKSETVGEYTKQLKAVAIVDKDFLDEEVKKSFTTPTVLGASLEIMIVSVKDLKTAYEKVFAEIPKL